MAHEVIQPTSQHLDQQHRIFGCNASSNNNPYNTIRFNNASKKESGETQRLESPLTGIEKKARDIWLDTVGIRTNIRPKFPRYSTWTARRESFASCTNRKLKFDQLCDAGFFCHGNDDCTVCFHCGGGLKEWKDSDNPWIEHAYWFPRCNYVITQKGKEFVDNAWGKRQEVESAEGIRNAADTLKELIDMFKTKSKNSETKEETKLAPNESCSTDSIESPTMCRICFVEERNIMFAPCRHVIVCQSCAKNVTKCVVCREKIEDSVRVYLS